MFALAGEWRGDATVRNAEGAPTQVLKQDLALRTDGERFYRGLKAGRQSGSRVDAAGRSRRTRLPAPQVYRFGDDDASTFESFGEVAEPSADFELVWFRAADSVLCLLPGCYVLAPLKITDKTFFVESGCFVDEDADAAGQLPISVRGGEAEEASLAAADSRRYLLRSTRLYAENRRLASVTTGYHQLCAPAAGDGDG